MAELGEHQFVPINNPMAAFCAEEARWYAAYTCANHEKRVANQFAERQISSYLPLYESVRRWKDRKKLLEVPLFPGYVFVHLGLQDRVKVLQVPGVVRLVGFNGLPTPLADEEIETLRAGLNARMKAEPHPYLKAGRRVRIVRGSLEGAEGILVRKKGLLRLVLSIGLIMRSVAVEVDSMDVEAV